MSVQEQIGKLESLLERIVRNAQKPREAAPESVSPDTARVDLSVVARASEVQRAEPTRPAPAVATTPAPATAVLATEITLEDAGDVEVLDMTETELVEVSAEDAGVTLVSEESLEVELGEPIPESAPRPAVQTIEREIEREPPVKTPPPESGRQAVTPIPGSPYGEIPVAGRAPVESAILEADLSGGPISKAPPGLPSIEQLGASVELPGAEAPPADLELAPIPIAVSAEPELEPLEVSLPPQRGAAAYEPPPIATRPVAPPAPPLTAAHGPVTVDRPAPPDVAAAEVIAARPVRLPATFLELLDASLGLDG